MVSWEVGLLISSVFLTIAALVHGQVEGVTHSGPTKLVLYFTGATNILFTFGGHAVTTALLVTFTVYIIPPLAHILTYRSASSRQNAAEKPPRMIGGWRGAYVVNAVVVVWVLVVGFGLGGWASVIHFVKQVDTFGLFAKCYQCPQSLNK
ncbi:Auxin transporter-like protein 1 [Cardamine amara subsp. amara]|uniref:Auxin transporter-like protein 1 n=1 Tax=Cardamine amara subsp. amara TaxID=228776 RepID=A0ABD1BKV4_CARAN